jgi:hypothetical protein
VEWLDGPGEYERLALYQDVVPTRPWTKAGRNDCRARLDRALPRHAAATRGHHVIKAWPAQTGGASIAAVGDAARLEPDLAIRTTFLVGHPAKREGFPVLLDFIEKNRFSARRRLAWSPRRARRPFPRLDWVSEKVRASAWTAC